MKRFAVPVAIALFLNCTAPQNKALNCISKSNVYTNPYVGISLSFPQEWRLGDNRDNYPVQLKGQFTKRKTSPDASPLFLGIKENGQVFVRCLIETTSTDLEDYIGLLWEVNKKTLGNVQSTRIAKDHNSLEWVYHANVSNFQILFYEIITKHKKYAIRLGFWTIAPLFPKYRTEFAKISESMRFKTDSIYVKPWGSIDSSFTDTTFSYLPMNTMNTSESSNAPSKCDTDAHPCLWKATRGSSTVYLFGSIHFGSADFYPLPAPIESAFVQSNSLIVEINEQSDSTKAHLQNLAQEGLLPKGKTLDQVLSAPVYRKLIQILDEAGLPAKNFLRFRPWLVSVTLSALQLQAAGYVSEYGIDSYFIEKAKENRKNILELETVEDQKKLFTSLNGEDYLAYTMLDYNTLKPRMKQLAQAWLCGKESVLKNILLTDYSLEINGYKAMEAMLLTNRNAKMASRVIEYLKRKGTCFMVVGIAHLISKESIVDILRGKGYTVEKL